LLIRAAAVSACAWLVAKALLACVDLASLGDGPPDGPSADAAAPPEASDPCAHRLPPPAPEVDADPEELPAFVLAVDEVTLDPDKVSALDLDGVCTCEPRPGTALDGGPSCMASAVTCDLDGGGDNALGVVATAALPLVPIASVGNRFIVNGHRTLLFQIAKYNGRADDGNVVVGSIVAEGIHAQGCPSSTFDPAAMLWSRGGCGDDAWTLSPSAVIATAGSGNLPLVVGTGYVRDFQLVVRFNDAAQLPTNDESAIRIGAPVLTGRLVPLDETLAPRDPARPPTGRERRLFRLEQAVLAGRVLVTEVLTTLGTFRTGAARTPLCTSGNFESVRTIVCGAPDIASAPAASPSARCDALSVAVGLVAIPALAADVADASVVSSACATVDAAAFTCP
jgi:hypothetical protein